MRKKILLAAGLLLTICIAYLAYQYNRKPADIRKQKPAIQLTASDLVTDFNSNEAHASQQYTDKIIVVTGTVLQVQTEAAGQATVFLKTEDPLTSVNCSFYEDEFAKVKDLKPGQKVTIKGVCTGKLMDVVLNKCSLL